MSPEFLLTAFIVCVSPGIGVVYTLSMTLGGGLRAGMLAASAAPSSPRCIWRWRWRASPRCSMPARCCSRR